MEFGKINPDEIATVDFTLPKDTEFTRQTLTKKKPSGKLQVHVGCAKWGRKEWIGKIYPKGTSEADFLNEYVKHFDAIELNATFYQIYGPETITKWREKAVRNPDFRFCPKFSRSISHIRRLKNAADITTDFLAGIHAFGDLLGPVFLQLSDHFGPKNLPDLQHYLEYLPKDITVFVELRHKDWFADPEFRMEVFNLLCQLGIGAVITDAVGRRDCVHLQLPTPHAFIRFVGNNLHPTDYIRVEDWVSRIKQWADAGLQSLWFFMHQPDERYSPQLADYVIKRLNEELQGNIRRPVFLDEQQKLF